MSLRFPIDSHLLTQACRALSARERLYWIVGGAGSGKTSICQALSVQCGLPVYDMDAHIYGTYHSQFTQERHPVNWA
jgi:uridine kinase